MFLLGLSGRKKLCRWSAVAFVPFLFAGAVMSAPQVEQSAKHRLSVADMVGFAEIGDPWSVTWDSLNARISSESPDGRWTAVVVRRGDVKSGAYVGSLMLFDNVAVSHGDRKGRTLASFAATGNHQPIALVRWAPNSRSLTFAGTEGANLTQLYEVGVDATSPTQLTHNKTNLLWYETSESGDTVAEIVSAPSAIKHQECTKTGCLVTAKTFWETQDLPEGIDDGRSEPGRTEILVWHRKQDLLTSISFPSNLRSSFEICSDSYLGFSSGGQGLSPNGDFALWKCWRRTWPTWWPKYSQDPETQRGWSNNDWIYSHELELVDLKSGTVTPLTGAPEPIYNHDNMVWIDGGKTLLMAGSRQALPGLTGGEERQASHFLAVLEIDPKTKHEKPIAWLPEGTRSVSNTSWDSRTNTLYLEAVPLESGASKFFALKRTGSVWTNLAPVKGIPVHASSTHVYVRQGLNERPKLIADALSGPTELLDPNPNLSQVSLGKVEPLTWNTGGASMHGGLYFPPGYIPGKRYPLVIQTHGFEDDKFSLTGNTNNFAAQAIAARDIVVLQVAEGSDPAARNIVMNPALYPLIQHAYEDAISALDKRGLIDPERVGLVGWSATGPYVGYFLTHSEQPIAATVFVPTGDYGWYYWLMNGAPGYVEQAMGSAPFGVGMKNWLEASPSFNLDRVTSPILEWSQSPSGIWDWNIILRRLKKPVEVWYLPDLQHDAYLVPQRVLGNELTVDWFDFWLNGHEDIDGAKADQYARWRLLREQQQASKASIRRPLLQWSASPLNK